MTMFHEKAEEHILSSSLIGDSNESNAKYIFNTLGSAGNNNEKLAKILAVFDLVIKLLGWETDSSVSSLSAIITQYQASIDAKYHDDFKAVLIAEEIAKKQSERKGISILAQ